MSAVPNSLDRSFVLLGRVFPTAVTLEGWEFESFGACACFVLAASVGVFMLVGAMKHVVLPYLNRVAAESRRRNDSRSVTSPARGVTAAPPPKTPSDIRHTNTDMVPNAPRRGRTRPRSPRAHLNPRELFPATGDGNDDTDND